MDGWCPPPNWTARDWREEMRAQAMAAACQAESDYEPDRSHSRERFVRGRVAASVLTRYRQEWSYARHCRPCRVDACPADGRDDATTGAAAIDLAELRDSVARLPDDERRLVVYLFWEGHTEAQAAAAFHTSQATVSRRRRAVLDHLRRLLGAPPGRPAAG